ncbi:hypothetical protein AB0F13_06225 [Streptomyces sp. NPDC026206]|uniref:hypothetical protein n=1 Tax=Streptomyces sp. NPDC026206 TaxID=3157089 RepID=UPI0033CFEA8B
MTSGDLTSRDWWRPCSVQTVGEIPPESHALAPFMTRLLASFEDQGHVVRDRSYGDVDLMFMYAHVPDGQAPLRDRIPEQCPPLSVTLRQANGLRRNPAHVVAVVEIPESLSELPHRDVVETARTLMGRVGAAKALFVTRGPAPGRVREVTFCNMEGGHPTEKENLADRLRDRLVTAACACQVADRYDITTDALTAAAWKASPTPERLADAGRRMGQLGLLSAPLRIADYVSPQLADMYEVYMGWKGFSEGMLFAFDPDLQALVVTASGSWDVDKRALNRDQVVVVDHRLREGRLRVLAPEGTLPMQPSVETWEVCALMEEAPTVRVRKAHDGQWVLDPDGEREVPLIRGGIHAHVGVSSANEAAVETVQPDRERFPYGFGCGTDLTVDLARNTIRRSSAVNNTDDPRLYVRWPLLYHGEMAVELWKPGIPAEPFRGLLGLFGTDIRFTPDHVEQPL